MLRIVTDGAADILPAWSADYGIDVIPVNILFGEKSYLQYIDLDNEDLTRFGCALSGHIGDTSYIPVFQGIPHEPRESIVPWYHQWLVSSSAMRWYSRSFMPNESDHR